jgi:hypothetical protein
MSVREMLGWSTLVPERVSSRMCDYFPVGVDTVPTEAAVAFRPWAANSGVVTEDCKL